MEDQFSGESTIDSGITQLPNEDIPILLLQDGCGFTIMIRSWSRSVAADEAFVITSIIDLTYTCFDIRGGAYIVVCYGIS